MNREQALLQTVLDNPDDNVPRLAYADYLMENGKNNQGQLIKCQIEYAQMSGCTSCDDTGEIGPCGLTNYFTDCKGCKRNPERLKARLAISDLLDEVQKELSDVYYRVRLSQYGKPSQYWDQSWLIFNNGLAEEIHCPLSAFIGGECLDCSGQGGSSQTEYIEFGGQTSRWTDCSYCKGKGSFKNPLADLFLTHPIKHVVLYDRWCGRPQEVHYHNLHPKQLRQLRSLNVNDFPGGIIRTLGERNYIPESILFYVLNQQLWATCIPLVFDGISSEEPLTVVQFGFGLEATLKATNSLNLGAVAYGRKRAEAMRNK